MPQPLPVLPMSIDEFHVMEHRLGWKHEYWDGAARLSPQSTAIVDLERPIEGSELLQPHLPAGYELRAIEVADEHALVRLFVEAFDDSVEYAGWDEDFYHRDAEESIQSFFDTATKRRSRGCRRGVAGHSFVISHEDRIVAAILIRMRRLGPIVEPVMVAQGRQRQGLGRALSQATLIALRDAGINKLYSRCHLGNAASLCWHEQNGFLEIPNYFAATHRRHHFTWLTRHFRHLDDVEKTQEGQRTAEHWNAVVETLEASDRRWSSELLD